MVGTCAKTERNSYSEENFENERNAARPIGLNGWTDGLNKFFTGSEQTVRSSRYNSYLNHSTFSGFSKSIQSRKTRSFSTFNLASLQFAVRIIDEDNYSNVEVQK